MTLDAARARSAARIDADVQTLAAIPFSQYDDRVCRYAYTEPFRRTIQYFADAWRDLGFEVTEDPVGNFVARNRPPGQPVFGIGSHCDSNRNGGRWDGVLGVATALEVCRMNDELGLALPLQAISFLEEEGSGFGQLLLGSRIVGGWLEEVDLRERILAIDDQRPFWEHALEAGYEPQRWQECAKILDDLTHWIELHIEQGRLLQDADRRFGVVHTIAGYVHGDITIHGRSDHAGATPMSIRKDSTIVAGMTVVELERLARAAGAGIVATVGEIETDPGLINVVAGRTRISIDVRGPEDTAVDEVIRQISEFAVNTAASRGLEAHYIKRQSAKAVAMDTRVVAALEAAGDAVGQQPMPMVSGAAHDTLVVAARVPSAMVFVPCKDGLSHTPLEQADAADAALAANIIIEAMCSLTGRGR
jgi:hydantoinase/carbamoylase family amidase